MGRYECTEYAVYKGDDFVCLGTISECAKKIGVSIETARYYTSPAYMKRAAKRKFKKSYTTITRIDDDEVE